MHAGTQIYYDNGSNFQVRPAQWNGGAHIWDAGGCGGWPGGTGAALCPGIRGRRHDLRCG